MSHKHPPTCSFVSPTYTATCHLPVTVAMIAAPGDGSLARWQLVWGDGSSDVGLGVPTSATHTYSLAKAYKVKLTVFDNTGSSASATTKITCRCAPPTPTPPVATLMITPPVNQTAVSSNGSPVVVSFAAPTTSGGTAPVVVSTLPVSGALFPVGVTTVACLATSADGQVAHATFTVTVTTAPPTPIPPTVPTLVLTVPPNQSVTSPGNVALNVTYPPATTVGGTAPIQITYQPTSGSLFPVGVTTVAVAASSADGQSASGSFTVTVLAPVTPPGTLSVTCPSNQTGTSTNGLPVAVTYPAATFSGGIAPVTLAYSLASGAAFPVGVTTVTVTATSSDGQTATCTFTVTVSTVVAGLLMPSDFTYLGYVGLPYGSGLSFTYGSWGALSGRVVGGNIHLFVCQNSQAGGGTDAVAEVLYNGLNARCTLVTNWGDVTKGKRIANPQPNSMAIRGIYWDPVASQLWWAYGVDYAGSVAWNPSIGTSTLNGDGSVTAYGPWRMGDHSQMTRGYMFPLPANVQAALGGGKRIGIGAPITSGDAASPFGAFATAFAPPANGLTPSVLTDTVVAIPTSDLIYTDITHRQARANDTDQCGWQHYGQYDSKGNLVQNNPVQDGSGCSAAGELCGAWLNNPNPPYTGPAGAVFNEVDQLTAATWIDGATKKGVIYIGQLCRTIAGQTYLGNGRNHATYGPTQAAGQHLCVHGQNEFTYSYGATGQSTQTMLSALYIYNPADLLAVANGSKTAVSVVPVTDCYDMSQIAHPNGASFPQIAGAGKPGTGIYSYGGAWFEPVSKLLFVSEIAVVSEGQPIIHVFSVNC